MGDIATGRAEDSRTPGIQDQCAGHSGDCHVWHRQPGWHNADHGLPACGPPAPVAAADGSFVGDMFQEHRVDDLTILQYRNIWPWDVRNTVAFERPIPYVHRSGAVRWVRLAETKVTAQPRSIPHPPAKASSCCTSESVALAPSSDEEASARLTNERSLARSLGPSKPSLDSVSLASSGTDEEASARLTNERSSARILCPSKRKSSGDLTLRRECKNVPATIEHMLLIFGLCCKRNHYTLCPSQAVLF